MVMPWVQFPVYTHTDKTQTMHAASHLGKKYINKYKQCPPERSRNIREHCPLEDNY